MTSRSSRRLSLAVAAVLGASGVALFPAPGHAKPLADVYSSPTKIQMLSQTLGERTTQNSMAVATMSTAADGSGNETFRLEATGGGQVAQVRFESSSTSNFLIGTVTSLATVPRGDNGAFAYEWDGGTNPPGVTVYVRARALSSSGSPLNMNDDATIRAVQLGSGAAVDVANAAQLWFFRQPYTESSATGRLAVVTGTVDSPNLQDDLFGVDLGLSFYIPGNNGMALSTPPTTSTIGLGAFSEIVDISNYLPPNSEFQLGDQLVLRADVTDLNGDTTSEDVEAFEPKAQTIGSVSAAPDRPSVRPGESAVVTVTVRDADGRPIAGAEVRNDKGAVAEKYTDAFGRTTMLQSPGTTFYYANATDGNSYEPSLGDKQSADVTISAYEAVTTSIVATSVDGSVFDLGEVDNSPSTGAGNDGDATDVTVQVKDQRGNDVAPATGQILSYTWQVTPFTGGSPTTYPATGSSTATSEGGGKYSIVVPAGGDGVYELSTALSRDPIASNGAIAASKVLTVKAGQAEITWDKPSPQDVPAGGTSTVTGKLALPDGSTLPGRALALTFQRDTTTTNEDTTPDAGFTSTTAGGAPTLTTQVETTAAGAIVASVTDPAETPQLSELGDNIDAASAANSYGNAGASKSDQVVNFIADDKATAVTLTDSRESSTLRPGEFTLYTVKVANRLGGGISGKKVTLTTDKGYFSKDDGNAATTSPTPSPAPANGADAGGYQNDGTSLELTTGSDGTATVFLAMGRDTGFDDDGLVTSKVTATFETLSASDNHAWTSANPLNGGTVAVVPSGKAQESGNLPKAQTSDKVYVDVELTDQFGNLVGGEPVTLSDDSATGSIAETDGTANDGTIVSDFTRDGDATLSTTSAAPQKVTATWTTEKTTYSGTSGNTTTGTETLTGAYTVEWYAVDYASSGITLTPDQSGTREVGSSVTMTYRALDQFGQPISDLYVDFARSGPGTTSDPATTSDALTGADGSVTYTFTGESRGTASVTATARQGSATGAVVSAASKTASVTFTAEKAKPDIAVTKRVRGNRLILKVTVTASTQDPVTGDVELSENGDTLATKVLNSDGKRKFVVRGVKKGFHSYQVTFLGNDEVKSRTRTVTINIR